MYIYTQSLTMQPQNHSKEWSSQQNLSEALLLKEQGNKLFQQHNQKQALRAYHKAILHLAGIISKDSSVAMYSSKVADPETCTRCDQLKYTIYLNMSQIYIQQQKFDRGLDILTKASAIQRTAKLYYRKAICLMRLSEFDRAREDLNTLITLDAGMKGEVDKLTEELRSLQKRQDQKSKNIFQKFFK